VCKATVLLVVYQENLPKVIVGDETQSDDPSLY